MTNTNETNFKNVNVVGEVSSMDLGTSNSVDLDDTINPNDVKSAVGLDDNAKSENETHRKRPFGPKPADQRKLAALLQTGIGGQSKHNAHAINDTAFATLKDLGLSKKIKKPNDIIVVNFKDTTKLGKFLERTSHTPFTYAKLGEWQCVAGLRAFLETSKEEGDSYAFDSTWRFAHSQPYVLKYNSYKANNEIRRIEKIKTIVADATYQKIMQNQEYLFLMADSTGMFVNSSGVNYERDWYMLALEIIRLCFKERISCSLRIEELEASKNNLNAVHDSTEQLTDMQKAELEEINDKLNYLNEELLKLIPDFSPLEEFNPKFVKVGNSNNNRNNQKRR
jgi:hypothetical protein